MSRDPESVPDAAVGQILRRAIALDADGAARMPLSQLRAIADEVGVSAEALSSALREFRRHGLDELPPTPTVWGARWLAWCRPLAVNAQVIAAAAAGLMLLGPVLALLRVPNFARAALLVLAVVLTADVARRRGAHTARRLSLGLLVALGVQFVTAFQTDWQLHGSTAQTVVILAAVAGVLVGAGVARYDRGTDGAASPQRPASTWARHVRRGIALVRGWWRRTPIVQRAF